MTGDVTWSTNTVRLLLDGEARYIAIDATGRDIEVLATGMTAADMRQAAYEGGPLHLVLDAIQLDEAIDTITDPGVKAAMRLRSKFHRHRLTDNDIQDLLWSQMGEDRPVHQLIKGGIRVIVERERYRSREILEVRAERARPVCWRCTKRPVKRAGADCGLRCPALVDSRARPKRKDINDMSYEDLVASQERGSVPGSEWARKNEVPMGLTIRDTA